MNRFVLTVAIALAAIATLNPQPTQAIELKTKGQAIFITGSIEDGDAQKFFDYMIGKVASNAHISLIVLDSPGGRVGEGHGIAKTIRLLQLNTAVPPGAECVSECAELFAAGMKLFAASNARVGGHRVSLEGGRENALTRKINKVHAKFLSDFGVPKSVIARFMATPPGGLYYLTRADMSEMGVNIWETKQ